MRTIEIRLNQGTSLSNELADMRAWLAREQCEPALLSCRDSDDLVIVHIDFSVSRDGDAFAKRFDGRILASTSDPESDYLS